MYRLTPQGQYSAATALPPNNGTPNMAAANFVVITNGEGCALNGTALRQCLLTNSVPRALSASCDWL